MTWEESNQAGALRGVATRVVGSGVVMAVIKRPWISSPLWDVRGGCDKERDRQDLHGSGCKRN